MRAFLVSMCDIFLILYLTAVTNVNPVGDLTVDDFYKLKSMHQDLQADKKKAEEELEDKLLREREEKERLLAQKQKEEALAKARLKGLAGEKEELAARLAEEKQRIEAMRQSLLSSAAEQKRINQHLLEKEKMLEAREKMLANLNTQIADQQQAIQKGRVLTEQLQGEVREVRLRAEETQARAIMEAAAKAEAERKAAEELAARKKAEAEKEEALKKIQVEQANRRKAEQNARILAATVEEIKQDGDSAFESNIRPWLQRVDVAYEREIADGVTRYERKLTLLPVKINEETYAVFPSRQIGFSKGSNTVPSGLVITYQNQKVKSGRINKNEDLIAIPLLGYEGDGYPTYSANTQLKELMPTLLALRNSVNVGIFDKVRGISEEYFIVNRDYLQPDEKYGFKYAVGGLPGTGTRAERIIPGDQLVDLNGELIGVANQTNRVVPVEMMPEWEEIVF